jgi:hypothetical protein
VFKLNKVQAVRGITKLYFVAALAGSFTHIITAAHKTGLVGWEAWSTPFMIDGLAVIGMVMRSEAFSQATRSTGLRVQAVMGLVSLVANVYAASTVGGVLYGVAVVALFLAAEWLTGQLAPASADQAAAVKAKRQAAAAKGAATRKANAATAKPRRSPTPATAGVDLRVPVRRCAARCVDGVGWPVPGPDSSPTSTYRRSEGSALTYTRSCAQRHVSRQPEEEDLDKLSRFPLRGLGPP